MWHLSLYKRQSCSYLAPAIVLITTLSIIAHTDNNATLKPARRSPIEAGTCLSTWRGTPRSRFLPLDRPRPGSVGARPGKSLAPDRGRGQAGGLPRGKRPPARSPSSLRSGPRCRGLSSPGTRGAVLASEARLEPAARRAAVDPGSCRGQDSGAAQGGHSAIGRACGAGGYRNPSAASEGLARHMAKSGKRSGPGRQRASWGLGGLRGPSLAGAGSCRAAGKTRSSVRAALGE